MDEYWELLEEQHEHDVVMTPSRIDAEEDGNAAAEVPEMRERERA